MKRTLHCPANEATALIESGNRVFLHGRAATPLVLIDALPNRAGSISDVELVSISMHGAINWDHPEVRDSFYLNSLFVSDNVRDWVNSDAGDYLPVFLSEIPKLFQQGTGSGLSGLVAGLLGTGGAVRGLVLSAFSLPKDVFIATSAGIDLAVDASRTGVYYFNGYIGKDMLYLLPALTPANAY